MTDIALDLAKKHLNLEESFVEDDELILGIISAAKDAVEKHVNESLDTLAEKNGGCLPSAIIAAQLMMIENLYQQRGIVGYKTDTLPRNYDYLIDLYRNYD